MKRRTRIFLLCAALALALGTFALVGCGIKNSDPHQKDLLLYLSFDEGSGTIYSIRPRIRKKRKTLNGALAALKAEAF